MLAADAGDIGLSKGPRMQSTPTLKDTDPHDVFAIESLLAAHAEKAPPLAHDPAPPLANAAAATHGHAAAKSHVHVAPAISVGASPPQIEPTFHAPDLGNIQVERGIQVEDVGPGEIKVDGLALPGERPQAKWVKRLVMALLGLCGAVAAAAWQHYGDQATAVAAEWAPPFVLAALSGPDKAAIADQPNPSEVQVATPAVQAAAPDPAATQPAATPPAQPEPVAAPATAASAESAELQTMTQDLAAMGQQVEELKATITELKASQAQMARELAKASGGKAAATRPEPNPRPKVSTLTPAAPRTTAPPPVRKPKPTYSHSPAPIATAPVAPLQAAAPLPPAPPRQAMADDGQPVVRPPMPLR
jgi:hypothetical protein